MHISVRARISAITKFFFVIQITLLSACDPSQFYEFHNRSGGDALIQLRAGDDPEDMVRYYGYVNQGDTKRLRRPLSASNVLYVVFSDQTWKYPRISYHGIGIFPCAVNHIVITPDGGLYNYRFGGKVPDTIDQDAKQPGEYPYYPIIIPQGLSGGKGNKEVDL